MEEATGVWTIEDRWRVKRIQYGKCSITIRRPILSEEERIRREEQCMRAMEIFARKTGCYEYVDE